MYRNHFNTHLFPYKISKFLSKNALNCDFEIVLNEILKISKLRNIQIKIERLIIGLVILSLATYFLSCTSRTPIGPPEIKIPQSSSFASIWQHNRTYVSAARPHWIKTGVDVQEGDKILIFASGEATIKTQSSKVRIIPPYNLLQLKIGPEGIPEAAVLFDNQRYFKPYETGKLMLATKEIYQGKTGVYLVDLFVIPEAKEELLLEAMQEISLNNPKNPVLNNHIKKFIELNRNLFFTDVEVKSSPSNASVFLDGFYQGKTPFTLRGLKLHGNYEFCLREEGYPDYCYFLDPRKTKNLFVELKKEYEKMSAIPKNLNEIGEDLNKEKTPPVIKITEPLINSDNEKILLSNYNIKISGNVKDENGVVWVKINGEYANLDTNGNFWLTTYLAVGTNKIEIQALDTKNNLANKSLFIERSPIRINNDTKYMSPILENTGNIDFGNYIALVIGNNSYTNLPKLKAAVNDAQSLTNILRELYGFTVELVLNGTRRQILFSIDKYRHKLRENDNFLIYYAGHGYFDKDVNRGYWLPIDADTDTSAEWISNADITDKLKAIKAKHVIIIADSCYSGTLTRDAKIALNESDYLFRMTSKKARTVLTSGGVEPVLDSAGGKHSVFAKALLEALKKNAGVMDGTTLFNRIRRPVMLHAKQTPQYSDIRFAGHEGGDFLFLRLK